LQKLVKSNRKAIEAIERCHEQDK